MEYYSNKNIILYNGKMQEVLPKFIKANSIDSIVTDPPYELNFMNKGWDNSGVAFQKETWEHCYRVLKEGGYLLAFGGSRTYHRIAVAIEDAGFEIRDTIMWLYGSGFPKSMNIGLAIDKKNGVESKVVGVGKSGVSSRAFQSEETTTAGGYDIKVATNQWQGWGTCLKPAFEPIIVARKPFKGSLVDNVIANGVGGLNIDECRVGNTIADNYDLEKRQISKATGSDNDGHFLDLLHNKDLKHGVTDLGRFPANVILTYDDTDFDEVCGGFPNTKSKESLPNKEKSTTNSDIFNISKCVHKSGYHYGDEGSAARYFYCAKASKKDRDEGLEEFEEQRKLGYGYKNKIDPTSRTNEGMFKERETQRKNTHPTVKPTDLMQYLVRLVTPANGVILDPFMGSGSTGKAVMYENNEKNKNYSFIGVEMTNEYLPIAKARIYYAQYGKVLDKQEKKQETQQLTLFDFI